MLTAALALPHHERGIDTAFHHYLPKGQDYIGGTFVVSYSIFMMHNAKKENESRFCSHAASSQHLLAKLSAHTVSISVTVSNSINMTNTSTTTSAQQQQHHSNSSGKTVLVSTMSARQRQAPYACKLSDQSAKVPG
jgi:hypothetical protein